MPSNQHLQWLELTDFTAGLYTEPNSLKQFSMPDTAAQQMDNCMPLKSGGIRAFFKPVTVSTTGITSIATQSVMGMGLRSGIANRTPPGDGTDRYLVSVNSADTKYYAFRMDGSNAEVTWKAMMFGAQPAGWTASVTTAAQTLAPRSVAFAPFLDTSGVSWMLMVIRGAGTSGLYKVAYTAGAGPPASDGVTTKLNAFSGPMAVNQARIIIGDGGAVLPYRIYYGDPGLTTGAITTGATFTDVAPYQDGAGLTVIVPFEPSDLLIGREAAPWVMMNGDITSTSTPIREMGAVHTGSFTEQQVARTPNGIAYIEPGGRIFLTDGRSFNSISDQLDRFYKIDSTGGFDHVNVGQMAFLSTFLFAPKGYIRDWDTGAWFRSTDLSNASHWVSDARRQKVWGVNGGTSFTMWDLVPFDRQSATGTGVIRYHTYTWRSAPLHRQDARQSRIREVQVFLKASAACSMVVTVTNADGSTIARTASGIGTGAQMISFLFPSQGSEYQDVTVTPTADSAATEAPIIESIRVGYTPGHQTY